MPIWQAFSGRRRPNSPWSGCGASGWRFAPTRSLRSSPERVARSSPSHLQEQTAPLVVGLLEEIRRAAYQHHRTQTRWTPPVRFVLDETANIAPIPSLPAIASEGGGQGLQLLACFQDLTQARRRWGDQADGFLTLFGIKIILPGVGDPRTLHAISTMVDRDDRSPPGPTATDHQTHGTTPPATSLDHHPHPHPRTRPHRQPPPRPHAPPVRRRLDLPRPHPRPHHTHVARRHPASGGDHQGLARSGP